MDRADLLQVVLAQHARGDHLDDRARAQGGFAGRPGGHAVGQAVDGHAQPAGGRAVDEDLRVAEADLPKRRFQIGDGLLDAQAHIALRRRWSAQIPGRGARNRPSGSRRKPFALVMVEPTSMVRAIPRSTASAAQSHRLCFGARSPKRYPAPSGSSPWHPPPGCPWCRGRRWRPGRFRWPCRGSPGCRRRSG